MLLQKGIQRGQPVEILEDLSQRTIDPFKAGEHSGLTFAYGIGIVRSDNVVVRVVAGSVVLTDNTVNYIEVTTGGVVSDNAIGFTAGRVPLYTVTTASGEITVVQDDRCFFSVSSSVPVGTLLIYTEDWSDVNSMVASTIDKLA